jgi:hypothetical protein
VSRPPVEDDTEVHEAVAAAPNGGAQCLEQWSMARGRVEWMMRARWRRGDGGRKGKTRVHHAPFIAAQGGGRRAARQ